jgi:hypothetical protein
MTLAAGLPDALAISFFLMPLPYILTAVVGVVRSAGKYRGPPQWATMAKIAVILWGSTSGSPSATIWEEIRAEAAAVKRWRETASTMEEIERAGRE